MLHKGKGVTSGLEKRWPQQAMSRQRVEQLLTQKSNCPISNCPGEKFMSYLCSSRFISGLSAVLSNVHDIQDKFADQKKQFLTETSLLLVTKLYQPGLRLLLAHRQS